MKRISIIVALAKNFAIGRNNQLLWHISADLKRFKRITSGHKIIMGKLTYESLPVKPLPSRTNIVITDVPGEEFEDCLTVNSIPEALDLCNDNEECFVIGGGSIYRQFLPYCNKLYITMVNKEYEADTFFPEIDFSDWDLIEKEENDHDEQLGFSYSFLIYQKKR
jgi:dihydrofolate reductase